MRFKHFEFGVIDIDGVIYELDLVIDRTDLEYGVRGHIEKAETDLEESARAAGTPSTVCR